MTTRDGMHSSGIPVLSLQDTVRSEILEHINRKRYATKLRKTELGMLKHHSKLKMTLRWINKRMAGREVAQKAGICFACESPGFNSLQFRWFLSALTARSAPPSPKSEWLNH